MISVPVLCPSCHSTAVIKAGTQANGTKRYLCQNAQCVRRIFLLQYQDRGRALEICRQVVDMALNGSGIRDTAHVLRISPMTVIAIIKTSRLRKYSHNTYSDYSSCSICPKPQTISQTHSICCLKIYREASFRAGLFPSVAVYYVWVDLSCSAHRRSELQPRKSSNGGWPMAGSVKHVEVDPPLMLTLYGHTVHELFASTPMPGGHEPWATASWMAACTLVHAGLLCVEGLAGSVW
jgi:transposase-like protein